MEQSRTTSAQPVREEAGVARSATAGTVSERPAKAQSTQALLEDMLATFRNQGADVVFGETREVGGRTIIPVAKAQVAFGFGLGRGGAGQQNEGEGGGGGGMVRTRPLGVIVVENDRVRFRPTIDIVQIATRGMVVVGIILLARVIFRR